MWEEGQQRGGGEGCWSQDCSRISLRERLVTYLRCSKHLPSQGAPKLPGDSVALSRWPLEVTVTWFFQAHVCEGARCQDEKTPLAQMCEANGAAWQSGTHVSTFLLFSTQKDFL